VTLPAALSPLIRVVCALQILEVQVDQSVVLDPAHAEIEYFTRAGAGVVVHVDEAGRVAFERARPSRAFPSYQGQRHSSGQW
jgi:hypothetical protein